MNNGAITILPETKTTLRVTLALVAFAAAGTLAWADVRYRLADVEKRQRELQANVSRIGERLGVYVSWPLDESEVR